MSSVVSEAELADLLKRIAEARHLLNDLRRRIDRVEGPLALLASAQLQLVSTAVDEGLLRLGRVARLVVSVVEPPEDV